MKKLIPTALLIVFTLQAQGYTLSSDLKLNSENEIEKTLKLQCGPAESICETLCKNPTECFVPETACEACATESSPLMNTIVTDMKSVFKTDFNVIDSDTLVRFLTSQKFMTISHDLFLNNTNPEKKDELKLQFESLCYVKNIQSAALLATLDHQNHVSEIVGAICRDDTGQSVVLPVRVNPLFSKKSISFWEKMQAIELEP